MDNLEHCVAKLQSGNTSCTWLPEEVIDIGEPAALQSREVRRLTGSEVGWVQHSTEVHLVPYISGSAGVGVAIHF